MAFEIAYQAAVQQREQRESGVRPFTAGPSESDATSLTQSFSRMGVGEVDRPNLPGVQPLRIHKKTPSNSYVKPKERPSWYAEAQLGEGSSFRPISSPSSPYEELSSSHSTSSRHQFTIDPDEENGTAPPPFEHEGPDLDGPPFEEVVLAYDGSASPSPSPLTSPQLVEVPLPSRPLSPPSPLGEQIHPSRPSQPRPYIPRSFPLPRRISHRMGPRPPARTQTPHVGFDPSVAYAGSDTGIHPRSSNQISTNATALYNSAVSSYLTIPASSKPVSQQYLRPNNDNRQSQYFSPESSLQSGGAIYRNPSPVRPMSQFSSFSPQQSSAHIPPSGVGQTQPYPQQLISRGSSGNSQTRWATSESHMQREFYYTQR